MKPSYGRVSRYGLASYGSSLDQIGPITQNVEDAAILYDMIAGFDQKDSTSADIEYKSIEKNLDPNRSLKIAVIDSYIKDASEDIQNAYANTIKTLKSMGHTIVHKNMMEAKFDIAAYYVTVTAEASTNLGRMDGIRYGKRVNGENLKETFEQTRTKGFGQEVKRRILLGNFVLSSGYYDAYYIKAQKVRQLIKKEYDTIFGEVDLILSPVAPSTAFAFGSKADPLEMYLSDIYTISVNLAGLPALSLPVGSDKDGMPIGLQLIGNIYEDQTVFDGAFGLEKALKDT
jgi:aspartyl-tRNA(Asn)/glutamyl-tRNA(Gln) amidotransferase subunit A